MKLVIIAYGIIVLVVNSAGQYRDAFYDADRDFSIINPKILGKKVILEGVFNELFASSKFSEITLVISLNSAGNFKVNDIYLQKASGSQIDLHGYAVYSSTPNMLFKTVNAPARFVQFLSL